MSVTSSPPSFQPASHESLTDRRWIGASARPACSAYWFNGHHDALEADLLGYAVGGMTHPRSPVGRLTPVLGQPEEDQSWVIVVDCAENGAPETGLQAGTEGRPTATSHRRRTSRKPNPKRRRDVAGEVGGRVPQGIPLRGGLPLAAGGGERLAVGVGCCPMLERALAAPREKACPYY